MEFILFCLGMVFGGIIIYLDVDEERKKNKKLMKKNMELETDLKKYLMLNEQYKDEQQVLLKIINEKE